MKRLAWWRVRTWATNDGRCKARYTVRRLTSVSMFEVTADTRDDAIRDLTEFVRKERP